jgi:D-tagatose-1,6-bisphosphate aldolase subunit GatZ/KbaZ
VTISYFDHILQAQARGQAVGIYSVCSAHPDVLRASLIVAREVGAPALIEATCNQVNQYGGYTGMTPSDFVKQLKTLARETDFPVERLLIGGDHLGPGPWQAEPAAKAMAKARQLVQDTIEAGYTKIHLDASMKCGDDPAGPLDLQSSAERVAELATVAEETYRQLAGFFPAPCYIIGSEVPTPGGAQASEEQETGELVVSKVEDVQRTIQATRSAFDQKGLDSAWERVIGVVVQPGVEFGNRYIHEYDPQQATGLATLIEGYPGLVYEAHSTDYQTREALRKMVADHFAILKVGPALTFAFREAVFALSMIEEALIIEESNNKPSDLREVLDKAMLENPVYWEKYYLGSPAERSLARKYSFSDRSRYYWSVPSVQASLQRLFANLSQYPIPLSLLSQYLPQQYERIRQGALAAKPQALVTDKIERVLVDYAFAVGQIPIDSDGD